MTDKSANDNDRPIGLLAGKGELPLMVARGVKRAGKKLAVVGFRGSADEELRDYSDRFTFAGITRWSTIIRSMKRWGVRQIVMVGKVAKDNMYTPGKIVSLLPDMRTLKIWYGKLRKDRRDLEVLHTVCNELSKEGLEIISSVEYCDEHLADEGLMTKTQIPPDGMNDANFAWRIAQKSAEFDIGQALAVKDADIVAVEAIEGTDRMIDRAGALCKVGGWTMVKVARPNQDMRFDVPTIGPDTLRKLKASGGKCLVVQAHKTIIINKPDTLALADELKIPVMGMI